MRARTREKSSQRNSSHSVSTTSTLRPRRRVVGVGSQVQPEQVVGHLGVRLGLDRRVERPDRGPERGQPVRDLKAGRIAAVVRVGLEGESPDGEPHPIDRAAAGRLHLGDDAGQLLVVGGDGAGQQRELVTGLAGNVEERPGVLGQARATPARSRSQELEADALVVAQPEQDVPGVGAHLLAEAGQRVDEAQLRGQERVGGVLDRLRRRRIGDDERRPRGREQLAHFGGRLRVAGADDDPIGIEAVDHGGAFAEELGVRHDADVGPTDDLLDHRGRADGHRRLVDHDGAGLQVRRDLLRRGLARRTGRPSRRHSGASGRTRRRRPAPSTASAAESVKESLPSATPPATSSSRPTSTIGMRPERSAASRVGSRSARTTECPKWARVAAVGRPT